MSNASIYNDSNWKLLLLNGPPSDLGPGVFPRLTDYGSVAADRFGLLPSSELVTPIAQKDWKEFIAHCHAEKIFPMYHRRASSLEQKPSQDGTNFCFPAGTLIRMANGSQQPIEYVRVLDKVLTAEGNVGTVTQTMVRHIDEPLLRLSVWGHSHLRATGGHPILTANGYVRLAELNVEDLIGFPKYAPESSRCLQSAEYTPLRRNHGRQAKYAYADYQPSTPSTWQLSVLGRKPGKVVVNLPPDLIYLTPGLGRIIGLYLAEGHTTPNQVYWSFHADERDTLVAELVDLLKIECGATATVGVRSKKSIVVRLGGTRWVWFFDALCQRGAGNKYVHPDLMAGPKDFLASILLGWLDGDRQAKQSAVTISRCMAQNMFDIANALGWQPILSIHQAEKRDKDGILHRTAWKVAWTKDGFGRGSRGTRQDAMHLWRRVRRITSEDFSGNVFNLEVESDHSYVAEGVGVHNCWSWSARATLENARLLAGMPAKRLAPISMAWLVNYRNQGNYLDVTIKGLRERGMASEEFCPDKYDYTGKSFKTGCEADAMNYRLAECWDTNRHVAVVEFIGQCLAILGTGASGYAAWNRLAHAMIIEGLTWDGAQWMGLIWNVFNSHGDGPILMAGQSALPDEFYGFRCPQLPGAA